MSREVDSSRKGRSMSNERNQIVSTGNSRSLDASEFCCSCLFIIHTELSTTAMSGRAPHSPLRREHDRPKPYDRDERGPRRDRDRSRSPRRDRGDGESSLLTDPWSTLIRLDRGYSRGGYDGGRGGHSRDPRDQRDSRVPRDMRGPSGGNYSNQTRYDGNRRGGSGPSGPSGPGPRGAGSNGGRDPYGREDDRYERPLDRRAIEEGRRRREEERARGVVFGDEKAEPEGESYSPLALMIRVEAHFEITLAREQESSGGRGDGARGRGGRSRGRFRRYDGFRRLHHHKGGSQPANQADTVGQVQRAKGGRHGQSPQTAYVATIHEPTGWVQQAVGKDEVAGRMYECIRSEFSTGPHCTSGWLLAIFVRM